MKYPIRLSIGCLLIPIITACQNSIEPSLAKKPVTIPKQCLHPAKVNDIWKLEPILAERGLIDESMSKEEKAKAINAYIAEKYAQYQSCLKGSKKK